MSDALEEFYTVAERVTKLKTVIAGDRNSFQNPDALLLKPCSPTVEIIDFVSDVRFRRLTLYPILYAYVNLRLSDLQPETAASL